MHSRVDSTTDSRLTEIAEKMGKNTATQAEKFYFKKATMSVYYNNKTVVDSVYTKFSTFKKSDPKMSDLMFSDFARTKFDLTIPLRSFNKPIYILCGREDFYSFLSHELKIAKPSAQLYWIEGSGHFPMYETPKEFYRILFEILDKPNVKLNKGNG